MLIVLLTNVVSVVLSSVITTVILSSPGLWSAWKRKRSRPSVRWIEW